MFIDTHCHISADDYDDIDCLIKENYDAGVCKIIVSGCEKNNMIEVLDLSKEYSQIYVTLGFHPEYADLVSNDDLSFLEKLLISNDKVVGIGEIGLDYHYSSDNKAKQIELFNAQLSLAEKLNLPVVIHSRDAVQDTIDILKKYKVKGVIHCFNGSVDVAKLYISMGYKLGIGGIVTFKNCKLSSVLSNINLNDIVLETDSPYLTPEPYRGKINSSKYIPNIALKLSEIYNVDITDVAKITTDEAVKLFKII